MKEIQSIHFDESEKGLLIASLNMALDKMLFGSDSIPDIKNIHTIYQLNALVDKIRNLSAR